MLPRYFILAVVPSVYILDGAQVCHNFKQDFLKKENFYEFLFDSILLEKNNFGYTISFKF